MSKQYNGKLKVPHRTTVTKYNNHTSQILLTIASPKPIIEYRKSWVEVQQQLTSTKARCIMFMNYVLEVSVEYLQQGITSYEDFNLLLCVLALEHLTP